MKREERGNRFFFIPLRAKISIGFILVVVQEGFISTMSFRRQ